MGMVEGAAASRIIAVRADRVADMNWIRRKRQGTSFICGWYG